MAGEWMSPLSMLYKGATSLRNQMFDAEILKSQKLSVPVISVGNITAGGTGKTPMVIHLVQYLQSKGVSAGVVSRGYGREKKGTYEVTQALGVQAGDEPALMKNSLGLAPIFVGDSRIEAGQLLLKENPVQAVVADDAFQHRYLWRDMNIVLIDSTQSLDQYKILPQGRARESLNGLNRATHLIFTKVGTEESLKIHDLKKFLKPYVDGGLLDRAVCAEYLLDLPKPLKDSSQNWPIDQPVTLVSGIGRPEAFEAMCRQQLNIQVVEHKKFKDHFDYKVSDIQSLNGQRVLTTEKDMVKLAKLDFDFRNWFYVPMKVELLSPESERFYEDLLRTVS